MGRQQRGSDPMNHVCDVISAANDLADLLRYGKKMVEHGLVSAHAGKHQQAHREYDAD